MTKNTRDTAGGRAYLDLQNRARRERRPTQRDRQQCVAQ